MVPGAARVPRAQPPAVRRPDLLHLSLRADGARRARRAAQVASWCRRRTTSRRSISDIYKELFSAPAGIAYNTDVERRFLTTHFSMRAVEEETVGCGVDLPQAQATSASGPATTDEDDPTPASRCPTTSSRRAGGPHLAGRGVLFKRRHRLHGPIALYGGRIDPGKGCEELIEYFSSYVQDGGDASLVLMGVKLMPLPEEPFIHFAGRLPDQERLQALEAATVVVVPSPYESLSLLALEAFAVGTPVLANARSEVLVDHCQKSNAGLYYADRDEFVEALKLLVADHRLRARDGRQRPRLRAQELPLGRDHREVRADVHQAARALGGRAPARPASAWYLDTMRSTIDKAGRVVIPAAIRDRAGLTAGTALEVTADELGVRTRAGRARTEAREHRPAPRRAADGPGRRSAARRRRGADRGRAQPLAVSVFLDTQRAAGGTDRLRPAERAGALAAARRGRADAGTGVTAWHCCLEFYSVARGCRRSSGSRRPTRRGSSRRKSSGGWPCTTCRAATACRCSAPLAHDDVAGGRIYDAHIAEIARAAGARRSSSPTTAGTSSPRCATACASRRPRNSSRR